MLARVSGVGCVKVSVDVFDYSLAFFFDRVCSQKLHARPSTNRTSRKPLKTNAVKSVAKQNALLMSQSKGS